MKLKMLPVALLTALSTSTVFAETTDLFISEYVEGSSNNKAIEIANLTGSTVDLSDYQLKMYFNGNTSAGLTINLTGSVDDGEVFVIAQASADPSILAIANQTQSSGWFNGDDAIVLENNGQIVDSIGQVGFDPGSQWGSGLESTQNNTLRRNIDSLVIDSDPADVFDPASNWSGFEQDTFDGLGSLGDSGGNPGGGIETACGEPATKIHEVQGSGNSTPMSGSNVAIEGIVVGDFQGSDGLRGFFVQEETSDQDSNAQTSEGIFIYDNTFGVDVNLGDLVRVSGRAGEFGGMTQLSSVTAVDVCAVEQLTNDTTISLPFSDSEQAETVEGMSVAFEQTLTVSENYNLGRYGELVISNGRLINPTNVVAPGIEANAMQAENDLNRIILDDGSTRQNPLSIRFPAPGLSAFNTVRGGDTTEYVRGVMHQAFGIYRIQPIMDPVFDSANPRTLSPQTVEAPLKVASFNVLNYFNGDGFGGGYPTARGADNAEEFARQRAKIINAIAAMDADIVGLMEIENDGFETESAITDLVEGVNSATRKVYQFVNPGINQVGTDAIAVGIIYDSNKVKETGTAVTLSTGSFADRNRQPLAQTFRELDSNGQFTVVVNHFKSKGSCPSDAGDLNADQGDGQGCWNLLRTQAAEELSNWLATMPTNVSDKDVMIIGDLNAYAMEDPIIKLESLGYQNLLKQYSPESYSYVFFGQTGTLDHALASKRMSRQVTNAIEWHINTDEPRVLDYNLEFKSAQQQVSLYNEAAFRASDHDPVIIGLNLKPELDVNNDGELNIVDLLLVHQHLLEQPVGKKRRYDLNRDGHINHKDIRKIIRKIFRLWY